MRNLSISSQPMPVFGPEIEIPLEKKIKNENKIKAKKERRKIRELKMKTDIESRKKLFDSRNDGDYKIILEDDKSEHRVHSTIILDKSEYFKGIFKSNMRETVSKTIHLKDLSRSHFESILRFLYYDDFTVPDVFVNPKGIKSLPTSSNPRPETINQLIEWVIELIIQVDRFQIDNYTEKILDGTQKSFSSQNITHYVRVLHTHLAYSAFIIKPINLLYENAKKYLYAIFDKMRSGTSGCSLDGENYRRCCVHFKCFPPYPGPLYIISAKDDIKYQACAKKNSPFKENDKLAMQRSTYRGVLAPDDAPFTDECCLHNKGRYDSWIKVEQLSTLPKSVLVDIIEQSYQPIYENKPAK